MFRKKFIDRLRDKYQTGGLSAEGRYRNPLVDPFISVGSKSLESTMGTRAGVASTLSIPFLTDGGRSGYYKSLRGEMDFGYRSGGREGIGMLESQLGPNHPAVRAGLPEYMNTEPKTLNAAIGLRGIYNRNTRRGTLRSNVGVGVGTGDYTGEYYRYNPDAFGDIERSGGTSPSTPSAPVRPYVDANIGLIRRTGSLLNRSIPTAIGGTASYGTKYSPNPGLRVGVTGSAGPLTGGVGYDVTSNAPRFNVGLKFQQGGVADLAPMFGKKVIGKSISKGLGAAGTYTGSVLLNRLAQSVPVVSALGSLYGFYKSGQKHSGGKTGYMKNPNYVEGSDKFGGVDSTAQFIPGGGLVKEHKPSMFDNKTSIYDNKTSIYTKQTGGIEENTMTDSRKTLAELREEARRRQYYQTGGVALPGGVMKPIPGSDAVEFSGQTHDEGGIMVDPQTEVEDGETMDKVTMAKKGGQKKDYFFSSYLKKGGMSFADMHKQLLQEGGTQEDIDYLAKMQEVAAKRDPKKIAKLGGVAKRQSGGLAEDDYFGGKDVTNPALTFNQSDYTPSIYDLGTFQDPTNLFTFDNLEQKAAEDAKRRLGNIAKYGKADPLSVLTPEEELLRKQQQDQEITEVEPDDKKKKEKKDKKSLKQRLGFDGSTPTSAYIAGLAQLTPAAYAFFSKQPEAEQVQFTPGFTSPVIAKEGKASRLERVDYNQDIANIAADTRAMNKFIETSGGGPANIINKMLAFKKGQDAKAKVRAAETRANIDIANREAQLEQQMTLSNLQRAQQASITNAQLQRAEAARMDQIEQINAAARQKKKDDEATMKGRAIGSFATGIAGILGDVLDYKSAERVARNIGSDGIYDRQKLFDKFIKEGLGEEEAKKKAAEVYNLIQSNA